MAVVFVPIFCARITIQRNFAVCIRSPRLTMREKEAAQKAKRANKKLEQLNSQWVQINGNGETRPTGQAYNDCAGRDRV